MAFETKSTILRLGSRVTGRVRSLRSLRILRRILIPKGMCTTLAPRGKAIRRQAIRRAKVTEEDLDWSEKSREIFETALDKGTEYTKAALDAWDTADDKPAVIAIVVIALTALYATNATLSALESVPFLGALLKVIGLYVSFWFVYRMVAFENDRDEIMTTVNAWKEKIVGE